MIEIETLYAGRDKYTRLQIVVSAHYCIGEATAMM